MYDNSTNTTSSLYQQAPIVGTDHAPTIVSAREAYTLSPGLPTSALVPNQSGSASG